MPVVLGCIADDFTGATDLASQLARSGYPVTLHIGVPEGKRQASDYSPFEIIALKCRTSPVAEAVSECRSALHWLRDAGATRFFWKYCSTFDSTPQGNIGPVAEALMQELAARQTIYCPAFPENGRRILMGYLFVGEQPLHESPMKDHPLTPMRDSNLMRLLAPQVRAPVGLASHADVGKGAAAIRARLAALGHEGVAHVVVDAVSQPDLFAIAEAVQDMPLLTGGSAIALPLPALYARSGLLAGAKLSPPPQPPEGGRIVLSGSCSAMTRKQVDFYAAHAPSYRLDPLALHKQGIEPALVWLRSQNMENAVMIYASAEPAEVQRVQQALGVEVAGRLVEDALAALAQAAFERGVRSFVVAGGETSGAVTRRLGVSTLRLGQEISPGVPWTFARNARGDLALALKSGNFGAEDFFQSAWQTLDSHRTGMTNS